MRFFKILFIASLLGCSPQEQKSVLNDSEQVINAGEKSHSPIIGSPLLQSFNTCENLNASMKKAALKDMYKRLDDRLKNPPVVGPHICGADMATMAAAPPSAVPVEGEDYSGTNNQEKDVDEADFIKNDGQFFYILHDKSLKILKISSNGELELKNNIILSSRASSILLQENNIIIFTSSSKETKAEIFSLDSSRTKSALLKSYIFSGELSGARRVGSRIHVATYSNIVIPGVEYYPGAPEGYFDVSQDEQELLWKKVIGELREKNENIINNFDFISLLPSYNGNAAILENDCAQTFTEDFLSYSGFLNLITLDNKKDFNVKIQRVQGNKPLVYASKNMLVLASSLYDNDSSTIHRFDIRSEEPVYGDSLRIPGTINNSFSLSEYNNYLRVATTIKNNAHNNIYILGEKNNKFEIISRLENLAPGERIWSARFSNNLGFLVTFRQVDPLFTLDLSDPFNPRVMGELKVPGVSTYLQDIGNNKLLAIGYDGNDNGLNFNTSISFFDLSNINKPKLEDNLAFTPLNEDAGFVSSEANKNHLAINYFAPKGLTAIPLKAYRDVPHLSGAYEHITKLVVVKTKIGEKLSIVGEVDHSAFYRGEQWPDDGIRRSYFVGDYIFAISSRAITSNRLRDFAPVTSYEFE
jgi:hypothetical protein